MRECCTQVPPQPAEHLATADNSCLLALVTPFVQLAGRALAPILAFCFNAPAVQHAMSPFVVSDLESHYVVTSL